MASHRSKAVHRDRGRATGDTSTLCSAVAAEESLAARCEAAIDAGFRRTWRTASSLAPFSRSSTRPATSPCVSTRSGRDCRRAARRRSRARAAALPGLRADRHLRALAGGMPALQLAEREPARSRHAGAAGQPRPAGARRPRRSSRRLCGVDGDDLRDMIAEDLGARPEARPALRGRPRSAPAWCPTCSCGRRPDGGWMRGAERARRCRACSSTMPTPPTISGVARRGGPDRSLADCLQQANWLEKSLDQRARTILKVAAEIVRRQDGFLCRGVSRAAAAEPAHGGRCDRHARIDREPRRARTRPSRRRAACSS